MPKGFKLKEASSLSLRVDMHKFMSFEYLVNTCTPFKQQIIIFREEKAVQKFFGDLFGDIIRHTIIVHLIVSKVKQADIMVVSLAFKTQETCPSRLATHLSFR